MRLEAPPFELKLLHPKYWLLWFFIAIAYLISWLPYPVLKLIGKGLGKLLGKLGKKRVAIARRNIELSFPDMPEKEREAMLAANLENAGMAMVETMMGWWWPDWRIKGISRIEGYEHVEAVLAKGKGVLGLAVHNMTLEVGCRVAGLQKPSVGFYRPHDNPVMEFLQYRGRARSNNYLISKRDLKSLFKALDDGEVTFYLPDQDYGPHNSAFAPLFAVQDVATTLGPVIIVQRSNCETVFINSFRDDKGYVIKYSPGLKDFPDQDDKINARKINERVEELIMEAPEQYLWMHKRYKTRQDADAPSRYDNLKK
ncbi:LpxL/LpxP family Kdo(2)-lipid IV(A) lauroyl/palmitoleoyl acyltransferase [Paraneptunicella aestuarii]|uniref:LpxL/LpxP family Kdo(2)-lipid IV(A) lauroyl/palmitoleoyl acyltransferase n=1 Tax=Paraneptunicella aestuarii TaxID=2831148 RepID=UPI001E3E060B|nr:LpxL/LpxP family Kdo(2)-lipid IV(A) lauroyl/palmitoleoyl acyltransferase [Paraneptunicella aestuarii]UAA37667.1 LpxL/LpxP family Kdo(2)-lipid IV(A) lauroyl/palmitoleoyl acyltransferase [Paraneptunicella aestuarii]